MSEAALLEELRQAITQSNESVATKITEKLLGEGTDPLKIIEYGLAKGIREVGDGFGKGQIWFVDLLGASNAMEAAMKLVQPALEKSGKQQQHLGRVLIGTVQGDIHDIGKNIVKTFFTANGFEVIDLGVDVPKETFVDKVRQLKPDALGMSALLTVALQEQLNVIEALKKEGLREKLIVMVGGAMTTVEWAQEIGADGYGADQNRAVELLTSLLEKRTHEMH
jgi:corrinoid protein of di/trimethylamine methyltransferase